MNLRTIISIEDNDQDFTALQQALTRAGIPNPLERCESGLTALAQIQSDLGCQLADRASIILLDLNMPGISGIDLLKEFRRLVPKRLVPVIILSTSSHPADIDECYRAGANAYVVKPFELDEWDSKVGEVANFWLRSAELPSRQRSA